MTTYVALLRSVNVSGRNKLPMSDFRGVLASLGMKDVSTYVQSGNAVFAGRKAAPALARSIERRLHEYMGVDTTVIVRSADELGAILDHSPFKTADIEPTLFHVTFLADEPDAERAMSLARAPEVSGADRCEVGTGVTRGPGSTTGLGEVYLHCPGGYGRTKLNNTWVERRLGVRATTRNWRTVQALAELAGGA